MSETAHKSRLVCEPTAEELFDAIANIVDGRFLRSYKDQIVATQRYVAEKFLSSADVAKPLKAEIERLRAIVDKLPRTADGVPITPGMIVYYAARGQVWDEMASEMFISARCSCPTPERWSWYSTPEAAKAARGGKEDDA